MQNRTGVVLCALALLAGFLMICLGAFFISSQSMSSNQRNLVMAYVLLPLGFVILLSGIFWSTYRQAKETKGVFSHVLRQHLASRELPLATVDRPDFYPPVYEESLDPEKQAYPAGRVTLGIPPPVYTETDLELAEENDTHPEAPPPYQECLAHPAVAALEEAQGPHPAPKAGPLSRAHSAPSGEPAANKRGWTGTGRESCIHLGPGAHHAERDSHVDS